MSDAFFILMPPERINLFPYAELLFPLRKQKFACMLSLIVLYLSVFPALLTEIASLSPPPVSVKKQYSTTVPQLYDEGSPFVILMHSLPSSPPLPLMCLNEQYLITALFGSPSFRVCM